MSRNTDSTGRWQWPSGYRFSDARSCGELIVAGGHVDLDEQGAPRNPGDLREQITSATGNAVSALRAAGGERDQVVKVVIYCVLDGGTKVAKVQDLVLQEIAGSRRPVITLVPVPYLAEPGIQVSIELTASTRVENHSEGGHRGPGDATVSGVSNQALRAGRFIFVGAQMALDENGDVEYPGDIVNQSRLTMERIANALSEYGASLDDAVKFNIYYVGEGTYEDWETAAKIRAGYFTEPGPVATGIPVPELERAGLLIKMEVWAMLGEDGSRLERTHVWPENHWDWAIHLPYKHGLKCEDMFFIGGQIATDSTGVVMHPGSTELQVHQCLTYIDRVIDLLPGVERRHIAKTTTFYKGDCSRKTHDLNAIPRSKWFEPAAPVSTEVALPALAFEDMMIEIEVLGSTAE